MNRTLKLLGGLSPKERQQFIRFAQFDLDPKHQVVSLLEYLASQPEATWEKCVEEGTPEINPQRISPLLSKTLTVMGRFLALRQLEESPGQTELLAFRQTRSRNLEGGEAFLKKAQKLSQKMPEDAWAYLQRYTLLRERLESQAETLERGKKMDLKREMQHLDELLDQFYALFKAQHLLEQSSLSQIRKAPNREFSPFPDQFTSLLEQTDRDWPLMQLLLRLLKGPLNPKELADAVAQLAQLHPTLSTYLFPFLWFQLHNQAIKMINEKQEGIPKIALDLFELGFTTGAFELEPGMIRPEVMKNLTELSCRQGLMDRVQQLLEKAAPVYQKADPQMYRFCRSILAFHQGYWEASLKYIHQIEAQGGIKDLYYQVGCRFLKAKIHFELEDFEACSDILVPLKQFIYANKELSAYHQDILKERVKSFGRLINLKLGSKPQIKRLILELEGSQIDDRDWLLAKAKEIWAAG